MGITRAGGTLEHQIETRRQADQAISSGRKPLDVMLDNMRFWDAESIRLTRKLEIFAGQITEAQKNGAQLDQKIVSGMMSLLDRMLEARAAAQSCAKDAAPYVHPRLAAIVPKPPDAEIPKLPPVLLKVNFSHPGGEPLTDFKADDRSPAMAVQDIADAVNEKNNTANSVIDGESTEVR